MALDIEAITSHVRGMVADPHRLRVTFKADHIRTLLDEVERLTKVVEPIPETYSCGICGRRDGLDTSLPQEQWDMVSDSKEQILCLWCIDQRAAERGITLQLALFFNGKAKQSARDSAMRDVVWRAYGFATGHRMNGQQVVNHIAAGVESELRVRETGKSAAREALGDE